MKAFYERLNQHLPHCLKLALQIEPRYCLSDNRHGTPVFEEFNWHQHVLNNYLNKTIKNSGLLHHMVLLWSHDQLNHHQYFGDGVHLKDEGLVKYQARIIGAIVFALEQGK
ncbi:hypothetical protein E2C01_098158 [Portunus trituberculatus]|uniref:Uncharacterized protein n=1 Tax=Portunus trituberculatus TaxID=210409 RepID=A0A5B7K7N1_PORTR|nr:hypothetical protein [Portunus trituberculatus]